MSYYLLPRTPIQTYNFIDFFSSLQNPECCISNSLSQYLYEIKEKIEENEKDWDIFKKYTNPYEYIHSNIPIRKKSVSNYFPLSRSFFKMIEIIHTFDLANQVRPLQFFHLAEGPGGFIEAFIKHRNNKQDKYVGMTLIDEENEQSIPSWKKAETFLKDNKNIYLEYGSDQTGNILSYDNFISCAEKYKNSMDVITGDGGFDFSLDFNKQEISISKLLFAQICFAICLQKKGGCFILKIFDAFMQHSIDLLYILSSFYEKVYIIKPHTSRYANSEKYVVCKNFLFSSNKHFFPKVKTAFSQMLNNENNLCTRFLNISIPNFYLTKLEEYNAIFGQQQIENIHYTLTLIQNKNKSDKINQLIQAHIDKCIYWCVKHNIPYTSLSTDNNIFLNPTSNYFI